MNRIACLIGVAAIASSVGASASADTIFRGFDNNTVGGVPMASTPNADAARADFLSALTTPLSNDLEALSNSGGPAVVPFGDSLTMTTNGPGFQVRDTPLNSAHGAQGPRFIYAEGSENALLLWMVFSTPIQSLGFTFTDASDWFGSGQNPPPLMVQIEIGDGIYVGTNLIEGIENNQIRDGSTGFFGMIADAPFTTVRIFRPLGGGDTDAIGFDGFIVPTPGAAGLLGLAGLVAVRRRR